MSYIGKQPVVGNFQVCDAITVVNGQAAYTMQVSSANVEPENANHMLVSLNGILQKPGSSFTISGATITFASNLATGDVIDFIILLGNVLDIGAPSDSSVTNAKLASDVISGETDIGGAIADADLMLLDDGAGGTLRKSAMSRIKTYVAAESNLPYFFATINTSQSVANTTETVLQYNTEVFDSGSSYNTGTYKWIPQTAGKYLIFHQWSVNTSTDCYAFSAIAKNGTNFARFNGRNFDVDSYYCQGITSLNGSTDYVTASGYHEQGGSISNASNTKVSYFGGFLISAT